MNPFVVAMFAAAAVAPQPGSDAFRDRSSQVDANPGAMFPREASMAKLKVTEVAKHVALEGMQMMGGYGYATEYDMEGHVRHSLVLPIYAGANEVQRDIISGSLGLR